jgi:hypothetical protein
MDMGQPRTQRSLQRPGTATDTDPQCQIGATTVNQDRPMQLRCRHDRVWPCPIGLVAALPGTVTDLKL